MASKAGPAFFSRVKDVEGNGDLAARLSEAAGLSLLPWQRDAVDTITALDADGLPAHFESGLIVPRQNGKGAVLEALALYWCLGIPGTLLLWSAHEFKTAAEAYKRLKVLLDSDALSARVDKYHNAAGQEGIDFKNGSRIKFVARSKGSGRGFSANKIILDESMILSDQMIAALMPTMATKPDAQIVYTSSAGIDTSDVLRGVRDRGRAGRGRIAWIEYGGIVECPDGCKHPKPESGETGDADCGYNSESTWAWHNPSAGDLISLRYIADERQALSTQDFGIERLGIWAEPVSASRSGISLDDWNACAVDPGGFLDPSDNPSLMALSINLSRDRKVAFVLGALRDRLMDGGTDRDVIRVTLLARIEGGSEALLEELPGFIDELVESGRNIMGVYYNPISGIASIASELGHRGVDMRAVTYRDEGAGFGRLVDAITSRELAHADEDVLRLGIQGGAIRQLAEASAWDHKKSTEDISAVAAMTRAVYAIASETAYDDWLYEMGE